MKDISLVKVGIVGNGFVGNAHYEGFKDSHDVAIHDIAPEKTVDSFEETVNRDIVFVCLPTPMFKDTHECNLKYIRDFFEKVNCLEDRNTSSIFVIKSTVPVGTTSELNELYKDIKILHSTEFLTAVNANVDFKNPSRNIVGGESENGLYYVNEFFEKKFNNKLCLTMNSNSSEFVKYFANTFFATKVSFFNEMYLLSNKLNVSWDDIVNGVMTDRRIGGSHYRVPGKDDDFGFGGTCFPKDINALISMGNDVGVNMNILDAAWKTNLEVRPEQDWNKLKGRAIS